MIIYNKTCKICGKEFRESENFNWSCRRHTSDWGGDIYWCCGNNDKNARGCKTNKHECKEDEEDLDKAEKEELN